MIGHFYNFHCVFNSRFSAVDAEVIIFCDSKCLTGIMLQVRGAVFICGIQQLFRLCRRDTVALLHPLQSTVRGRANEEIQQIFVSLQNTVRARPTMVYEPSSSWIVQT